jgi:Uncharacterised nucleotidyltransferase
MMTGTERWLLAFADPEDSRRDLPGERLTAPDAAQLCLLAEMHGVLPAVLARMDDLLRGNPGRILNDPREGPAVFAAIDPTRTRLAQRAAMALFLTAETRRLMAELSTAGISALPLKGSDFASRLYRTPALRPFGDVDLLVRRGDGERVSEVMSRLGYQERETRLKYAAGYAERTWENPAMPGAMVEVHENLVNSPTLRDGVSVAFENLPLDAEGGANRRPAAEGLLIVAAVHGAASHSFDKLQHLCDIAQIVRGRAGTLDLEIVNRCLGKTGAAFSVAAGLDLTARVLREEQAAQLLERLEIRWPRRLVRLLLTPALVARSQGPRRRGSSWRRQWFRHLLKNRR